MRFYWDLGEGHASSFSGNGLSKDPREPKVKGILTLAYKLLGILAMPHDAFVNDNVLYRF
jgi:hypothetical protein